MKKPLFYALVALLIIFALEIAGLWYWTTREAGETPVTVAEVKEKLTPYGPVEKLAYDDELDLFRAHIDGRIVHVSPDGRYLFTGDLHDLTRRENLTEQALGQHRRDTLSQLDEDTAIVFAPDEPAEEVVWVFTDVDCPYCRRFHEHMDAYNDLGIEVRYLAYPRSGPGSETWRQMEAIWCAENRKEAITQAKAGENVAMPSDCPPSPIKTHYQTGQELGLRGTPMVLSDQGKKLGGYLPPARLATRLGLTSD